MRAKSVQAVVLGLFLIGDAPSRLYATTVQPVGGVAAEAAALRDFNQAIAVYLTLRRAVRSEVSGPVKNSTSAQVTNDSDALAGAIQRRRRGAMEGAIFNPPVAAIITARVAHTVRAGKLQDVLSDIDDEGGAGPAPKVHLRLPVSAQMATMPASMLAVLPPLPKELEYRIIGRYLIIRDVDASLILDYIPNAVPR